MKRFNQCPSRVCVWGRSESCISQDQVHKVKQRTIFIHDLMFRLLIPDGCPQDTLLWAQGPKGRKKSLRISSWFHRVWGEHSRSHTGGFAGMVFLPKPDPRLSRGQHTLLRNLKHGPSAPARTFSLPKGQLTQRGIPTGAPNMKMNCACTLLDITKKHSWRPHGLAISFWAAKGSGRHRLGEVCRQQELHLSPPDSSRPGRQQLTFIFTSQDLSVAILAVE